MMASRYLVIHNMAQIFVERIWLVDTLSVYLSVGENGNRTRAEMPLEHNFVVSEILETSVHLFVGLIKKLILDDTKVVVHTRSTALIKK